MNLYLDAGLLSAFVVLLVWPFSTWLARASWVTRSPRAAVALWHSTGLSATLATIGAGLCVATERFHAGFVGGLGELTEGLVGGHPLQGLGLPDALGLTLAADVGVVLVSVIGVVMLRTVLARARHRRLLNLLADPSRKRFGHSHARTPVPRGLLSARHPSSHRHQLGHGATSRPGAAGRGHRARTWTCTRAPRAGNAADDEFDRTLPVGPVRPPCPACGRRPARDGGRRSCRPAARPLVLGLSTRGLVHGGRSASLCPCVRLPRSQCSSAPAPWLADGYPRRCPQGRGCSAWRLLPHPWPFSCFPDEPGRPRARSGEHSAGTA